MKSVFAAGAKNDDVAQAATPNLPQSAEGPLIRSLLAGARFRNRAPVLT